MAKTTKKLILAAAVAAGLLLVALIAVLFTEFDSPELGRLALGQVGKASGFDLQAQGFRLNLLRGLELDQVEARSTSGDLAAAVDKLVLKHRPMDLLGGTLTVTEILIDRPRVEIETAEEADSETAPKPSGSGAGGAAVVEPEEPEKTSLDLAISSIRLVDGSLTQRDAAGATTTVRGFEVDVDDLKLGAESAGGEPAAKGQIRVEEVEMTDGVETTTIRGVEIDLDTLALDRGMTLAGTSLTGEARFAEVVTADPEETATQATDVRGQLELAEGRFQMREIEMATPQGALKGEFTADVAAEPLTYSLDLHGDALSTGVLLGIGDLRGLGTSTFKLQAAGEGPDPARIAGAGSLTINGGELPDHPALAQVEQLLGNVALIGAGYEAFPVTFDIRSHRVHVAPCTLRAGPISLTLGGWVDFDGPLEMELTVLTPREGLNIKEIPSELLEVLAEEDGRVNLPMLLTGTADGSKVGLNKAYLEQLAKRYAKKRVQNELGKALGRLFGDN